MAPDDWARIWPFVASAAVRAEPQVSYTIQQLLSALAPLALWTWRTAGLPLELEVVLSEAVIDRYIAEGMSHYTMAGRGTTRSRLRAMARVLTGEKFEHRRRPMGKSDPVAPYTNEEIPPLMSWAATQSSDDRRTSALVLLALGLGAGLFGQEIIETRLRDISVDEDGAVVSVSGERPREVPVLREWEEILGDAVREGDSDNWAFRAGHHGANHNLITDFIARSRNPVPIQARRMRSTWLIHHLNIGTSLVPLLRAAGLKSPEGLSRFLKFADQPTDDEARVLLRGESEPPRRT